jgi:hypothetical protein
VTAGARWIDPYSRQPGQFPTRRAWFAVDQYRHPHESKHTFGEVAAWFDGAGLEFVRGVPALRMKDDGLAGGNSIFEPQPRGTALDHFLAQTAEIVAPGQREGGFFVMIGRKPAAHATQLTGEDRVRENLAASSRAHSG